MLQTDMPLGRFRSSGSRVRFPVRMTLLMLVAAMKLNSSYAVCGRSRVHTRPEASGAHSQEVRQKCGFFGEGVTWLAGPGARPGADPWCRPLPPAERAANPATHDRGPSIANAFLGGLQVDAGKRA